MQKFPGVYGQNHFVHVIKCFQYVNFLPPEKGKKLWPPRHSFFSWSFMRKLFQIQSSVEAVHLSLGRGRLEETLQSKFHQPFLQEESFINWGSDGVIWIWEYIFSSSIYILWYHYQCPYFSNILDVNISWFLPIPIYLDFLVEKNTHISLSRLISLNNIFRESDEASQFDVLFCCIAKYQAQKKTWTLF